MNDPLTSRIDGRGQRPRRARPPLDANGLRELALAYVARFATSRARLARYLERKLFERGWEGTEPADVDALVARIAGHGYIDDAAYAEARARSLARRGFGGRRIADDARASGIAGPDRAGADRNVAAPRIEPALRLAQRRRWGPYAAEAESDPARRAKQFAAFIRAGHEPALARAILGMQPGEDVDALVDDDRGQGG